jgi:Glycosyl hydrolases family 16
MYINEDKARTTGLANVTYEQDILDFYAQQEYDQNIRNKNNKDDDDNKEEENSVTTTTTQTMEGVPLQPIVNNADNKQQQQQEPFIYMGSAPTDAGPRDSIRLEGKRRFNRGLFIIDVRHMPAGCGVWPAFWLTDEANWPVNGEIDIVEGVNYQSHAKTALHSTKGCVMDDIPAGTMTGAWDTAVGIPDRKTGVPDMTMRLAQNCFVYDPHQWLNQGCVAYDLRDGTLGIPLNEKGGGVYALEWDPVFRHMRTWVFTPHKTVPDNLRDAIRTANLPPDQRVLPDPDLWPVPYGYFAIGEYNMLQISVAEEKKANYLELVSWL